MAIYSPRPFTTIPMTGHNSLNLILHRRFLRLAHEEQGKFYALFMRRHTVGIANYTTTVVELETSLRVCVEYLIGCHVFALTLVR